MKVLVINCGSSSLKYQLFDMKNEDVMAKGGIERINLDGSFLKHEAKGKDKIKIEKEIPDHRVALGMVLDALINTEHGVISSLEEISAVGHRIVHAGEKFSESVRISDEVMETIKECIELAPLHNPPNIIGIEATKELIPDVPMVAVFDTAFHQTMPEHAFIYGLPYELYEKHGIRRYGFHGTSHKYVSLRAAAMLEKPLNELKIVTCHLGNGSSITAVKEGKSIDTSMGFTPLEGVVMGTRCGNVDPAIVPYLVEKEQMNCSQINSFINKESGVLGVSGVSNDFRDLEEAEKEGNKRAKLALDIFTYGVKKYIGSYAAAMGGIDALVFTAGIGENSGSVRMRVCEGLEFLGIDIDPDKNKVIGEEMDISKDNTAAKVLVIPTNEELMIARDTKELIM